MNRFFDRVAKMLRRRPALMLYTSVALLPILTLLFSSAMRVLFGKGDFALVFGELERTVLPILRAEPMVGQGT